MVKSLNSIYHDVAKKEKEIESDAYRLFSDSKISLDELLVSTAPSVAQQQEILEKTEELQIAKEEMQKLRTTSMELESKVSLIEKERKEEKVNLEQAIRQLNFQLNIVSNELKTKDAGMFFHLFLSYRLLIN